MQPIRKEFCQGAHSNKQLLRFKIYQSPSQKGRGSLHDRCVINCLFNATENFQFPVQVMSNCH
jgi:hypothetical protein